jgi:hypothetical protein
MCYEGLDLAYIYIYNSYLAYTLNSYLSYTLHSYLAGVRLSVCDDNKWNVRSFVQSHKVQHKQGKYQVSAVILCKFNVKLFSVAVAFCSFCPVFTRKQ